MSRQRPATYPYKEPRKWTRADIASTMLTFFILYALSPPWMIALTRVTGAPSFTYHALAFCYHPLSSMRSAYPPVDRFYNQYRILVNPFLSGL